jgi:hypothetical protein
MFGYDEIYQVMLWDSPSLQRNLELLGRLPKMSLALLIYTDRKDEEVLPIARKARINDADVILGDLADCPNDARLIALAFSGVVVDRRGKPVPGCMLTVSGRRSKKCFCTLDADDHGKFHAICLPPVTYRLQAVATRPSSGGHGEEAFKRDLSASVDVKPGDESVRIVLDVADAAKKSNR